LADRVFFSKIDDQNRSDHSDLTADDECYFLFEYTSHKNYSFSKTNSLISNLKKRPSLRHTLQYQYKTNAIRGCGELLSAAINMQWLAGATLVPVPPSKVRTDPEYDDRILRICRAIQNAVDVRELVVQRHTLPADHESGGHRLSVEDLLDAYAIDESVADPAPQSIGIVDDVLTNGRHFRAVKLTLQARFPGVDVAGFFIARRVFPNPFEPVEVEPR